MTKIRVYELAKSLGVENKVILSELVRLGIRDKTHSSGIEDAAAAKVKAKLTKPAPGKAKKKGPVKKPAAAKGQQERDLDKKTADGKPKGSAPVQKKKPAQSGKRAEAGTPAATAAQPSKTKPGTAPPHPKTGQAEAKKPALPAPNSLPPQAAAETDAERVGKLKSSPGMKRAFQSIRRVEPKRWHGFKRSGRGGPRKGDKKQPLTTAPRKKTLKLQEGSTVKDFAELVGLKVPEVIKKFMELGYMPNVNQPLDFDAALLVADALGVTIEVAAVEADDNIDEETPEDASLLVERAPVITIMGHVDHGKTSLLDAIRKTNVTESEKGGITQHIGAYKVTLKGRDIVFLDTPGHEAFTALRARGAKVTDIVVLVVAADDGVKPQTIEAIDHAKAAEVPIIVAVNKIDKPDANLDNVRRELSEHGILSEEWGGESIFAEVSAKQRIGLEHMLEMILLQADVLELKANPKKSARGIIIEARLDKGRGPIATVLIQSGRLKIGDAFLSGINAGKVRALNNDSGKKIKTAGPSTPVEVIGFTNVPMSGDMFIVLEDEKRARQIALSRLNKQKSSAVAPAKKLTLDDLYAKIKEGEIKDLNIVIKADVQGSAEALQGSLEGITHPEVQVKVIHSAPGGINESDVMLAMASNAIVIGFNVRPDAGAAQTADREGVDIRLYGIIYEAIEDVKKALEGMLEPTLKEKVLGRAEVRNLFQVSRLGTIAGCYVTDGQVIRACDGIRVIRDGIVTYQGKISSLKRFKEDVKEVQTGYECGIMIENFNDLKVGDILENFVVEEIATKL